MANVEGESPNFDEFKLPDEEATPAEPTTEGVASEEEVAAADVLAATPIEDGGEQTTTEEPEGEALPEEEAEEETQKEPSQLPVYLEWSGAIGIPLVLLALGWFGVLYFSTAIYIISVGFVPYGIWKGRKTSTVFTVILGCALVAILTAVYCLWLELVSYRLDIKAQDAKQRISMVWPTEAGFLAETGHRPIAVSNRRSAAIERSAPGHVASVVMTSRVLLAPPRGFWTLL